MELPNDFPAHVTPLKPGERFQFSCHPGVSCFNECCRQLDLALSPYDVLCLKNSLGLTSGEFLDQYAIIEDGEENRYPMVYLGMIDDGRASCPFVSAKGCTVYQARPGACRTYPLGRAAFQTACGGKQASYVLVREDHCQGFSQGESETADQWIEKQGLLPFHEANDEVMTIVLHRGMQRGLTVEERAKFLMALYDLDRFREFLRNSGSIEVHAGDDLALLRFGVSWLRRELFAEKEETVRACARK